MRYLLIVLLFSVSCKNRQNTTVKIERANPSIDSITITPKIAPKYIAESQKISSFIGNTVLTDTMKATICMYLDDIELPFSKKFYINALSFIYQSCGDMENKYEVEENFNNLFRDKSTTLRLINKFLTFKKINEYYFLYVVYQDFNLTYQLGYSYIIFDKKGDILADYIAFGGQHCCDVINRKIEVRDWNNDGEEEIVINYKDNRRFDTAIHEDVLSYDSKTKQLRNIFQFDKMFTGSLDPKLAHVNDKKLHNIDFYDTSYYSVINTDTILAHYHFETRHYKTKEIQFSNDNDYYITKGENGFYLNQNYTYEFWKGRVKQNIFYNPFCESCYPILISERKSICK
jgi:hypothetical protein